MKMSFDLFRYLAHCSSKNQRGSDVLDPPPKRRRVISPPASPLVFTSISLSKYFTFQLDEHRKKHNVRTLIRDVDMVEATNHKMNNKIYFDMTALPNEILQHIFSFLPPTQTRTKVRMVCRLWNEVALIPLFWQHFEFPKATCQLDTETLINILSLPRFCTLRTLIFGWTHKVDDNTFTKLLEANPSLKSSLHCLEIHRCSGVDDRSMKKIAMFSNLRCLKMYNSSNWKGITDAGMQELAKLSKLEVLQLNFFKRITNDGITEINKLKNLQELHMSGAPLVSDAGISAIKLPKFNSLSLSLCGTLTDKSLTVIPANLPSLKFLSLGYNNPNSYFTDAGLTALRDLRRLQELRLERSWGHLSGDGVRALREANPNLLVRNW
eukprot:Phypoly_transcript_08112.p1 GENE.Phypoly_transcript_08112~~Phypoly_transcript_08112.p1  ORF type:complete len:380 (+),score=46.20 Phypoly_transcript_08112:115-1254(+)